MSNPPNFPDVSEGLETSGPTSRRPTNAQIGFYFYDFTLQTLLVYNGSGWSPAGGSSGGLSLGVTNWVVAAQAADARVVSFTVVTEAGAVTNLPQLFLYLGNSAGLIWGAAGLPCPGVCATVAGGNPHPVGFAGLGYVTPNGSGTYSVSIGKNTACTYYLIAVLPGQPLAISPAIVLS